MSQQESRISDEEFERRLNAKSYDTTWRNSDEKNKSQELQTYDWLHGQRQQSGQNLLSEMKDFQQQKQMVDQFAVQQQDGTTPITANGNLAKQQNFSTKIVFPKDLQFENFANDKYSAFFYFSNHPKTSNKFDSNDVTTANNLAKSRNSAYLTVYFSISVINYYMTRYLKYRNIPWGITYKFSFIGFFTKYFFFPLTMAGTIDKYVMAGPFNKSMEQIYSKYQYAQDPLFKEVFESQQKK